MIDPCKYRHIDLLRHAGCDNFYVLLNMLHMMHFIGQAAKLPEVRQELIHRVHLVQMENCASHLIESDQQHIHELLNPWKGEGILLLYPMGSRCFRCHSLLEFNGENEYSLLG